jgi:hypothetical protein
MQLPLRASRAAGEEAARGQGRSVIDFGKPMMQPDSLYWDCKMIDDRDASVYVVADTTITLIERTPARIAERIVWTHNAALAKRDGISVEQFPEIRGRCHRR